MRLKRTLLIVVLLYLPTASAQVLPVAQQSDQELAPLTDATIMPAPYAIEVYGNLGGLDIAVEAGSTVGDAYVKLVSHHDAPVRCDVLFKSGPESRPRGATLAPEAERLIVGGLRREVVRLRIGVTCKPAE